jgi:galacturonosyltransferase 12/13/14/15
VKDLYKMLERAKLEEVPAGWKIPESYHEFMSDVKSNKYDAKTFALRLKAMVLLLTIFAFMLEDTFE